MVLLLLILVLLLVFGVPRFPEDSRGLLTIVLIVIVVLLLAGVFWVGPGWPVYRGRYVID